MTSHVSTHIDALGHIGIGDTLYGGASANESVSDGGLSHGGIEQTPPFITRAVLIDVAAYKGVDRLDAGYAIQAADLEGALQAQGVDVSEGIIVLIHTGSDDTFLNSPEAHAASSPGLSLDAGRWLSRHRVVAVGADNHALEVQPGEVDGVLFPVHQHLLVNQGIYIIENMKLDELAERRVFESTLIMLPTKFTGATGAPVKDHRPALGRSHAPSPRHHPRAVCRHRQARRRRHGGGVSSQRYEAGSGRGAESPAASLHG